MPSYKVKTPGFFNGEYYHPKGKRPVLHTDKPFSKKDMPTWLVPLPKESAAVKAKREAQKESQAVADTEKVEQDKNDIANASTEGGAVDASFLGKSSDQPGKTGSSVETL